MKALAAVAYGPPDHFAVVDLPVPVPGPGQIQVRIAAAPINPTDIRAAAGDFPVELEFPHVLGTEFAGTVTEVGPGVTNYAVGDEVFGSALPRALRVAVEGVARPSLSTGTLAEYAVFEADTPKIAHRPAGLTAEQAAVLPIAGGTALAVMATMNLQPGESVLVIGATGGVGSAVVPLLTATGAKVVATARTDEAAASLRQAGVDDVVGYDHYPSGVDAVLNMALPAEALPGAALALRPGGRLMSIMWPAVDLERTGRDDIELEFLWDPDGTLDGARQVAEAASAGRLSVPLAGRYTLGKAVEAAVDYARRRPFGKIVVSTHSEDAG